jgi:hypothetical protein
MSTKYEKKKTWDFLKVLEDVRSAGVTKQEGCTRRTLDHIRITSLCTIHGWNQQYRSRFLQLSQQSCVILKYQMLIKFV